jgi:plasmid stability protein
MGQLLVRGLEDRVIHALKQRATRSGRSVEAEHRALLLEALAPAEESFAERAARMRRTAPTQAIDSADMIRADRDRDQAAAL